jgi:hypothetical protein
VLFTFILPAPPLPTSKSATGDELPIPTLADPLPSIIALLSDTFALYPIAVALVKAAELTSAPNPRKVLKEPVVFVPPAETPTAVLSPPPVLLLSALYPIAVLLLSVLLRSAWNPNAVFAVVPVLA